MNSLGGILRYLCYAVFVTAIAELVLQVGMGSLGGLELPIIGDDRGTHRSRELAVVEQLQNALVVFCGLIFAWIAFRDRLRRPLALGIAGLFLLFLVRELDYFLDRWIAANSWQVIWAVIVAVGTVYLFRHRKRLELGWRRSWPSAGLAILISGLIILIPFTQIVAHEAVWQKVLPDQYLRAARVGLQELMELSGYLIATIGSIEFLYAWSRLPETRTIDRPRRRLRR